VSIKKWQDGEQIPSSDLWYSTGEPDLNRLPINITPAGIGAKESPDWGAEFQALVLGTEVVNDTNGKPQVEVYLGQTDGTGRNYVIRISLGGYDTIHVSMFFQVPTKEQFAPMGTRYLFDNTKAQSILGDLVGDTVTFTDWANNNVDASDPRIDADSLSKSYQARLDLANFSIEASRGNYLDSLAKYPDIARIVGSPRRGVIDQADQPYVISFKVANIPT
jgi:hypothetical protein